MILEICPHLNDSMVLFYDCCGGGTSQTNALDFLHPISCSEGNIFLPGKRAMPCWEGGRGWSTSSSILRDSNARHPGPSPRNWWALITRKEIPWYPRSPKDSQQQFHFYPFRVATLISAMHSTWSYTEGNKPGGKEWVRIRAAWLINYSDNKSRKKVCLDSLSCRLLLWQLGRDICSAQPRAVGVDDHTFLMSIWKLFPSRKISLAAAPSEGFGTKRWNSSEVGSVMLRALRCWSRR